ncbi:MarC family protein [Dysgonomonas sp. GY617]|uniref:MarC family protein n=1 Tax=Dysgonomonas sp. GY617 TaxID=2780420 RepID=UPI001883392C|nr:MarC family protein [Dysgonomonas sp. GY617]MBF0575062.1 MarC family protein [Dysgonomonas sp. GY617]
MSISNLLFIFSSSFMALFPVINPLGNGFIVNGFLTGLSDQQRKSAIQKIIVNYLLIGIGTLLIGHLFLLLFGLAIPVIQLGGGILICKAAMELLSDNGTSSDNETKQALDNLKWKEMQGKIFYPITFPMSIGPGSISVLFTLMASASVKGRLIETGINYSVIALVILCMAAMLYIFLTQGRRMMEKLGTAGNLIINKLVAFFTFCIGIQIIVTGISKIFHLNIL